MILSTRNSRYDWLLGTPSHFHIHSHSNGAILIISWYFFSLRLYNLMHSHILSTLMCTHSLSSPYSSLSNPPHPHTHTAVPIMTPRHGPWERTHSPMKTLKTSHSLETTSSDTQVHIGSRIGIGKDIGWDIGWDRIYDLWWNIWCSDTPLLFLSSPPFNSLCALAM